MITYSVLGFLIGALAVLGIAFAYGGLALFGLKMVIQGKGAQEHARQLAETICMAQASLWDKIGFIESAGLLVMQVHRGLADPAQFFGIPNAEVQRLIAKYNTFVYQGNYDPEDLPEAIICDVHGESLYAGHIRCLRCFRVYESQDAPAHCLCGYRLLPDETNNRPVAYSAKTVCKHCYKDHCEEFAPDNPDLPVRDPLPDEPVTVIPNSVHWGECPECESIAYVSYGTEERTELQYHILQCPVCGNRETNNDEAA